jgi:hypothetical protein
MTKTHDPIPHMSNKHEVHKSTETGASLVIEEHTAPTHIEKKKKKKYSSKFSRNLQLLEKGQAKASKRIAEAVTSGLGVWLQERDASAAKKRDGALKDHTKNISKALRKALKESAEAPADFLDSVAKMKIRPRW